jgi:signal transduction histidine kinase/CheY-like chemotaxis protein
VEGGEELDEDALAAARYLASSASDPAEEMEEAAEILSGMRALQGEEENAGGREIAAHDFNSLLAVLSTSLEVLATRLQRQEDLMLLDIMRSAVERGETLLTEHLLSFARTRPLKVGKYNLNSLIGGFEAVLRRAATSSIAFEVRPAHALRAVSLDAAGFEAALLNLVVNARDAMPGGGKLTVDTENVDLAERQIGNLAAGAYVKVSVADTGRGMPAEVAARVFEPFFATEEIGKGTGPGLGQVYRFIAKHGGDVVIESEVGKGTTVSIYLPAIEGETADTGAVLIVEDEPDSIEMAAALFRTLGYEVLTASNGQDAIDILKRRRDIGILFTNVMLSSGMNGIELARFTRKLCPGVKVILVSGDSLPALQAEHGNFDDFMLMSQPYRLSELEQTLRAAR